MNMNYEPDLNDLLDRYCDDEDCDCDCNEMYFEENEPIIKTNGDLTVAYEFGHEYDGIEKIVSKYPWVDFNWLITKKQFLMNDKIVAITKCHPSDTYNEWTGRCVALKKLNEKIRSQRNKVVKNFEKYINRIVTTNLANY